MKPSFSPVNHIQYSFYRSFWSVTKFPQGEMLVCVYLTNTDVSGLGTVLCTSHGTNWGLLCLEEQSSVVIVSEKVVKGTISSQHQSKGHSAWMENNTT